MKNIKNLVHLLLFSAVLFSLPPPAQALTPEEAAEIFLREVQLNLAVNFSLAKNSVNTIECYQRGLEDTVVDTSVLAKACFITPDLISAIEKRPEAFTTTEKRKSFFFTTCTESTVCEEVDTVFGGKRKLCGHTGGFLDYLNRVLKLPSATFTIEDARRLCAEAIK